MTAYALDYRADRLVIAADTIAYDDKATSVGEVSKVLQLPHLRAVILSRGKFSIALHLLGMLFLKPGVQTIEDAAAALPALLRGLTSTYAHRMAIADDHTAMELMEVAIAGWSDAEQRMRLWRFDSTDDYGTQLQFDLAYGGPLLWPSLPREYIPLDRSTDTVEAKLIGILHGVDRWCVDNPEAARGVRLGGAIELTTVTESGLDQHVVGYFAGFEPAPAAPAPARQPNRQTRRAVNRRQRQAR